MQTKQTIKEVISGLQNHTRIHKMW